MLDGMENQSFEKRIAKSFLISRAVGLFVSGIATTVLIGWVTHNSFLTKIGNEYVSMKFNTAALFLISGIALVTIASRTESRFSKKFLVASGFFIGLIAILTLIEYFSNLQLGIDELFIRDNGYNLSIPGRMAEPSAFCFVLVSYLILGFANKRITKGRSFALLVLSFLALLNICGYIFGAASFYRLFGPASMALHTAFCFFFLAIGIMLARPRDGFVGFINLDSTAGIMLRRLVPAAIVLPLFLGWLIMMGEKKNFYGDHFDIAIFAISTITTLIIFIWRNANLIFVAEREKMRAISAKLSAEEHAFSIVSTVSDAIVVINEQGVIQTWNPAADKIFGYHANEVIGKNIRVLMPEPFKGQHDSYVSNYVKTGVQKIIGVGREVTGMRKNGEQFPVDLAISEFKDNNQRFFTGLVRDISQRKESERQLREQLDLMKLLIERSPITIAMFDNEMRYLMVSESWKQEYKISDQNIIGRSQYDLFPNTPEGWKEVHQRCLRGAHEHCDAEKLTLDDGTEMWLQWEVRPWLNGDGGIGGIVIWSQVITERIRAEKLRIAKEAADEANRAKSAFLANMSHEIRTPLGAVMGFSQLICNDNVSDKDKVVYSDAIKRNGELLLNIINDILDISKVEAGKIEIESIETPLRQVIHDVASLLELRSVEKGLTLTVAVDPSTPSIIHTDPMRLKQILINIIGNAIKFTEKGNVDINVQQETENGKALLVFIVKDTGAGINSEEVKKLFSPFGQADISTTRKYGGTGLGLVLSKKLANLLGGDVELVKSEANVGSTFKISINPGVACEKKAVDRKIKSKEFSDASNPDTEEQILGGLNILLAEDVPDNQILLSHYLKDAGGVVTIASNGDEAIQKAKGKEFDIILMDLQMPVKDGFEATSELRKHGYVKPILALTAHAMKEDRRRCLSAGFDDHIIKPVDPVTLLQKIARHVTERRQPEPTFTIASRSDQ